MICSAYPDPQYLFFLSDVPALLYYSHLPAIIISLLMGFFVYFKDKNSLLNKVLLFISLAFSFWALLNLITWTNNRSGIIMFVWSFFGIVYSLLSVLSVYFVYIYINKKDASFLSKVVVGLLILPTIFFAPTKHNINNFDVSVLCGASSEGVYYTNYYYGIGFISFIWIIYLLIGAYRKKENIDEKKQIALIGIGVELFLLSFFVTGYIASLLTENSYNLEFYGLFGMTFFMGMLAYLIVRYKAFNIKLIGAQALVVALNILIGSQLFFVKTTTNRVLTGITLALSLGFGWVLIKSVKKEIAQREELEIVNKELDRLDKAKNEFINIASHQLRTPITVIKGVVSMIQQGDMDKLPQETKTKFFDGAMVKCNKLEEIINDILNATSLSNSKFNVMDKQAEDIEVKKFFETMIEGFRVETLGRNIDLSIGSLDETVSVIQGQSRYLEEAFTNLITNAIKYTPSSKATAEIRQTREGDNAKITISSKRDGDNVIFSVKDNGIGIPAEEIPHLFQKFFRAKNATAMYVDGTGLGLFIIKEIAQGHGGDVWAESEIGKGTEFFIKLPIKQVGKVDVKKFIEAQANLKM